MLQKIGVGIRIIPYMSNENVICKVLHASALLRTQFVVPSHLWNGFMYKRISTQR